MAEITTFRNPILNGIADPDVLLHEGVYYLYGTNTEKMPGEEEGIPVYTSTDLVHWICRGMALRAADSWGTRMFWEPDVVEKEGVFYMSYTVEEHLAVATASSPLGPFVQREQRPIHPDIKEIDSHYFRDEDGKWYLYYVRFCDRNEIWGAELTEDLHHIKEETAKLLLVPDLEWECVQWPVNEAPYMLKHDGRYYLTYSGSHFASHYGSGYAVAESPLGNYVKYENNPVLASTPELHGVGHHCFATSPDGKRLFILYHCHCDDDQPNPRKLCVDSVHFEGDVLVVDGPTQEQPLFF